MPALVCIYMRFANCVFKKNLVEMEGFSRVYKISPPFRGSTNRFSKDLLTALSSSKATIAVVARDSRGSVCNIWARLIFRRSPL